jgi:hypothetical protein
MGIALRIHCVNWRHSRGISHERERERACSARDEEEGGTRGEWREGRKRERGREGKKEEGREMEEDREKETRQGVKDGERNREIKANRYRQI